MAQPARARENASNLAMTRPQLIPGFWAAVEDCLVQFHNFPRSSAAEKVTDFLRRLSGISVSNPGERREDPEQSFDDMIYHAEPWYLACNLAGQDVPLEPNRTSYQGVLEKNHLM